MQSIKCNEKNSYLHYFFLDSYEVFICTVKKIGCEAFLAFAGIGAFYVSDNPESAIEESKLYFPSINAPEEAQSDDEDKPEDVVDSEVVIKNSG